MDHITSSFSNVFSWGGGNGSEILYPSVAPTNVVEEAWLYLHTKLGDFGLFVFFYLSMATLYGLGGLFFYFIDKYRLLSKYKIQYDRYATDGEYARCVKSLVFSYLIVILPLGMISFPLTLKIGLESALPLPPVWVGLAQMAAFLFLEDLFHYGMHRFFHTPWFYKNVHKEHHYYAAPFGLAASYAHPIETICLGMCTFTPAFIVRPHFFVFYLWFIVRQLDAVHTHSGYDLPLNPFDYLPYFGGASFHDFHHKAFNCNYGSRFTWTDKLFGTYRDPPHAGHDDKVPKHIKPASMEEEMKAKRKEQ